MAKGILILLMIMMADVIHQQEDNIAQKAVRISIGDSITFYCDIMRSSSPVWVINRTYYNINRLPTDYRVELQPANFTFTVKQAQLWMNNTKYGCYSVETGKLSPMGLLYVTFEFVGPEDMKVEKGAGLLIPCNSSIITQNRLSIVWKIDDKYYNPTRLPDIYTPTIGGLYINEAKKDLNGRKFQCLFKSDILWKDKYFKSKTATITVIEDKISLRRNKNKVRKPTIDKFTYRHQGLFFNDNSVTIAWNNAPCSNNFTYKLVKMQGGNIANTTSIHDSNEITLTRDELIFKNTSDTYDLYIQATANDNQTCSVSEAFINVPAPVRTKITSVLPGHDQCFNDTGLRVVWPKSPSGGEDCICDVIDDLSGCSCIDDTIYNVELVNKSICWRNLSKYMNQTKIFFFQENFAENLEFQPLVKRKYLQSFEIIVAEPPGSPEIYASGINDNGKYYIFIDDSYTGHSPVIKYNITITDNTGYSSTFNHSKTTENEYVTIPDTLMSIMNPVCGPQYFTVSSMNALGSSAPSYLEFIHNSTYDKCECIFKTVEVTLASLDISSTSISLQVNCRTEYNSPGDIEFMLSLINSFDTEPKVGRCNGNISFSKLKADTTYLVSKQWNHCIYDDKDGPFQTLKPENNRKLIIMVATISGAAGGIIVLIIVFIIASCRRCIRKCKHKMQKPAGTHSMVEEK